MILRALSIRVRARDLRVLLGVLGIPLSSVDFSDAEMLPENQTAASPISPEKSTSSEIIDVVSATEKVAA